MSYRAAVILIENGEVALIERHRQGLHYYTFPGGHVEDGETPEQTAVREIVEELGLQVVIRKLVATVWWHEKPQYYFLAEAVSGTFGTGTGEEMLAPHPVEGTYTPVWIPIKDLLDLPIKPYLIAKMLVKAQAGGWPDPAPVIQDKG